MSLILAFVPFLLFAQDNNVIISPRHYYVCKGDLRRCTSPLPIQYDQFGMRRLDDFVAFSDLVPPGPPVEHYQTFLAEVISQRKASNVVALWGDAAANADHTRVWGGFLTARMANTPTSEFPSGADAQLRGLEVDVLNAGLPGVAPNMSKVGIEIVGFGNTNTAAVNVLSEGRGKGRFANMLVMEKMSMDEDGTVFGIGPQKCKIGLNLQGSTFTDAAILLSQNNRITFRGDGKRDASIWLDDNYDGNLVLTAGPSGLRVTNSGNNKNLMYIHPDGSIDRSSAVWMRYWPFVAGAGLALFCMALMTARLFFEVRRLRRVIEHAIGGKAPAAGVALRSIPGVIPAT